MDDRSLPYLVDKMRLSDIKQVMEIERLSFSRPWSATAYRHELRFNKVAHYFVARPCYVDARSAVTGEGEAEDGLLDRVGQWLSRSEMARAPIVGYGGFWLVAGEAHISTIAVRPEWRRRGIGELLLASMISRAMELIADVVTLEVRRSNLAAQALYRKYGFAVVGIRKGYYSDNREDALIMTTEPVASAAFRRDFKRLFATLQDRLMTSWPPLTSRSGSHPHRERPE